MKKSKPENLFNRPPEEAQSLYHITDALPGIRRKKRGIYFVYYLPEGETVKDTDTLLRIKSLVLPPAWKNVWISPLENSHLQATGIDAKGRKQYRYHTAWNKKRSETKFSRLPLFAAALPKLNLELDRHLKCPDLTKEKVVATVIRLMSKVYIRVGNTSYARDNGSYGLTTLRDRHVDIHGNAIRFTFKGKKGVMQDIELHDRKLAGIVKSCKDIPGYELFQYYDRDGRRHVIDSGDINRFLHSVCGHDFSAKDFRTWAGSFHAFKALKNRPVPGTGTELKRIMRDVVNEVSRVLGNTPAVCRKYYIHPVLPESFASGALLNFFESYEDKASATSENEQQRFFARFLETLYPV